MGWETVFLIAPTEEPQVGGGVFEGIYEESQVRNAKSGVFLEDIQVRRHTLRAFWLSFWRKAINYAMTRMMMGKREL